MGKKSQNICHNIDKITERVIKEEFKVLEGKSKGNQQLYWDKNSHNNPKVAGYDVIKGTDYPGHWKGLEDFGYIGDTCHYGKPNGEGYISFRLNDSMKFFFAKIENNNGKPKYTPVKPNEVPKEILRDKKRWGYKPGVGFNPYAMV